MKTGNSVTLVAESYTILVSEAINLELIHKHQVEDIERTNLNKGKAIEQLIHNVGDVLIVLKEKVLCIEVPRDATELREWVAHSEEGSKVKCYDALVDVFISSHKYLRTHE